MRNITLKVPLRALAVIRCGQCCDSANPRIQALGDALDDAALAGSIAAFKQYYDLVASADHPVLQLDQFALEAKQFTKVLPTVLLILRTLGFKRTSRQRVHGAVIKLHLQLFVIAVNQVVADTPHEFFVA